MPNTYDSETPLVSTPAAKRPMLHTVLLAGALFLIPVLLGLLFVVASHRLSPRPSAPSADALGLLTNRIHDGSATQTVQLAALRRELREAGLTTDELDIRLWAARAHEPEKLFHVSPPSTEKRWNWHLSQDGLFALAVSVQLDRYDRRNVGLFDLVGGEWAWTNALPWPDAHEAPHVFNRHLIIRYVKNANRFALEVDARGTIISIDRLGVGTYGTPPAIPAVPHIAGHPVAIRHGVFFAADPQTGALTGFAQSALPGLRDAGPDDGSTVFSGNGLLLFRAAEGRVTVSDSLTRTVLQTFEAWPHTTNTTVTGVLATRDGSGLTVFLKTVFDGSPPVQREWSVAVDVYAGTVTRSFNADALFAKPDTVENRSATTPDGRWTLAVDASNTLTVSPADAPERPAVRLLLSVVGIREPIRHIAFLEQGRHLLLRGATRLWLLDFTQASAYGGLTARIASSSRTIPLEAYAVSPAMAEPDAMLALSEEGYGEYAAFDPDDLARSFDPDATAPSYLALRAELCVANNAWGYAAGLLEEMARLQEFDPRAPRINPLLAARCQFLADQPRKAHATCRDALRRLLMYPEETPRMIRYHLQGLLFAAP